MWPFRKKTPPAPPPAQAIGKLPRMNEDWRPGDLAVCIADDWRVPPGEECLGHPRKDDVLMVTRVAPSQSYPRLRRVWGLTFRGYSTRKYDATCFRKVVPDVSSDETELSERIKRCRPAKLVEPA